MLRHFQLRETSIQDLTESSKLHPLFNPPFSGQFWLCPKLWTASHAVAIKEQHWYGWRGFIKWGCNFRRFSTGVVIISYRNGCVSSLLHAIVYLDCDPRSVVVASEGAFGMPSLWPSWSASFVISHWLYIMIFSPLSLIIFHMLFFNCFLILYTIW